MLLHKDFNYSYWELKTYFSKQDLIIVGSGIVGISTAISFVEKFPKAKVLILERGIMPDGASTKNAGFACFGSAGEILDDLKKMPHKAVWETVNMRWQGLQLLRNRLKDKNIAYKSFGGFELFNTPDSYELCLSHLKSLNSEFENLSGLANCFSVADSKSIKHFRKISGGIFNKYEGQLDTSLLMKCLLEMAAKKRVKILNTILVKDIIETETEVKLNSDKGIFRANKVVVATNGFAASLLNIENVLPARAQVLITREISNLKIKGCYHFEEGYYYFRNIDNRILFGGGRNLAIETETTTNNDLNPLIQDKLDYYLKELILPGTPFEIENRWTGIMGVGKEKKPIITFHGKRTLIAVRMGGMGVAIGSWVGKKAADMLV